MSAHGGGQEGQTVPASECEKRVVRFRVTQAIDCLTYLRDLVHGYGEIGLVHPLADRIIAALSGDALLSIEQGEQPDERSYLDGLGLGLIREPYVAHVFRVAPTPALFNLVQDLRAEALQRDRIAAHSTLFGPPPAPACESPDSAVDAASAPAGPTK